jgi:8-oxo-dGTP pyrophosphatase MutT (NUDIX family)
MAPRAPVVPRLAATVVLVREDGGRREVFLTKRPASMAFLGGYYVFPGGRVDAVDRSPGAIDRLFGADLASLGRAAEDGHNPAGFFVAAIRELFEEAGVLLLCDGDGNLVPDHIYREIRADGRGSAESFVRETARRGLFYAGHRLTFLQLFVTPAFSPIRFYTVFFRADLPAGQSAGIEDPEVERSLWIGVEEAIEKNRSWEFPMIPPTVAALWAVAGT